MQVYVVVNDRWSQILGVFTSEQPAVYLLEKLVNNRIVQAGHIRQYNATDELTANPQQGSVVWRKKSLY